MAEQSGRSWPDRQTREQRLDAAVMTLIANSRDRRAGLATVAGIKQGYMALLLAPMALWLTAAVLDRAVAEALDAMAGDQAYVPSAGDFLGFCRLAKSALEDEAERAARLARPALPGPALHPPPDSWARKTPEERRAFAERHIAIGKLRARHGRLLARDGTADDHGFAGEQIAAVVDELQRTGWGTGPLATDARRATDRLFAPADDARDAPDERTDR